VENDDTVAHTLVADDGSFTVGPILPSVSDVFPAPLGKGPHPFHVAENASARAILVVAS
jgi:hypothetical protein